MRARGGMTGTPQAPAILRAGLASSDMPFLSSIPRRPFRLAAVGATMGALGLAISGMPAACLTAYPPPLPDVQHRPTILPDEVPAVDVPLLDWPRDGTFIAYLDVDPGSPYTWAAFL